MQKYGLMALLLAAVIVLGGCAGGKLSVEGSGKAEAADLGSWAGTGPALIRLEDVGPGGLYKDEESLEKLAVVADYLYQEGVPFHVGLIPRFVEPQKGYDVSIADDTPYARKFVETMKYLQSRGGIIGIHGYTHQTGYIASGLGFEFYDRSKNPNVPDSYEFARERVEAAIKLFEKAGITPGFWETPHYTASPQQNRAFEEQFGLLYENNHRDERVVSCKFYDRQDLGYRGYTVVPTPLGYIGGQVKAENMLTYLDRVGDTQLASFFYHPFREFGSIHKVTNQSGETTYTYDPDTVLKKLIREIQNRGYTFVPIHSLVGFVPAQRLDGLPFGESDQVVCGRFGAGGKTGVLVWNRDSNQWVLYDYTAARDSLRKAMAFTRRGVMVRGWQAEKDALALAGDFNGDGMDDLVLFSPGKGTFRLALNRERKLAPEDREVLALPGLESLQPLVGDFNGDGQDDLAVYDRDGLRIGVAYSNGIGFDPVAWQKLGLFKGEDQVLLTGDFNGDLKSEIAVLDTTGGEWKILIQDPSGSFAAARYPWLTDWGAGDTWRPLSSDVNGDGRSDLVIYSRKGYWQVALSNGKGFVPRLAFGPWGAGERGIPLLADLNNDGRYDLVVVEGAGGKGYNLDLAVSYLNR